MMRGVLAVLTALLLAPPAIAQQEGQPAAAAEAATASQPAASDEAAAEARVFRLRLDPIFSPDWDARRELRLGLWESPMTRLEFTVARELWAARHGGPTGLVTPTQHLQLPMRMDFTGFSGPLGPWNQGWDQLSWQEKVGAGLETGFLVWLGVQAAKNL